MFSTLFALYRPKFATTVVYMLQSTEYQIWPYLRWFWRTSNFSKVMHRQSLVKTRPAKLLLYGLSVGLLIQYIAAVLLAVWGIHDGDGGIPQVAFAIFIITPIVWAHLVILPLLIGRHFLVGPYYKLKIKNSKPIFAKHKGFKIAVAGSYGKTTMKEILLTVLSEGKKVAATPANKNVSISHAIFAAGLYGKEEILIIEYGEGGPGDVARFSKITKPNMAIITGLAPAHLDKYKTLKRAAKDIFSVAGYLKDKNVYVNAESAELLPFTKKRHILYDSKKIDGWRIDNIKVGISGLKFNMKKGRKLFHLSSGLIGRHQVGPLALAVILADKFGLSKAQIEHGIKKIEPFEHRMKPRKVSGAWLLDDTYNGNIEGMKAGLQLLKELRGKRKIYITPGLVDQGAKSAKIHQGLGKVIAEAKPDIVILMRHSVTPDIEKGLREGNYKGELKIEEDPLSFYVNLDQFIAAGDVVMMQNDWPDQYS